MNLKEKQVLDNLIFVTPEISLISGRFKVTHETLGIDKKDIPPSELSSLGSMYIFDKKRLSLGTNIKSAVNRLLEKKGICGNRGAFALTEAQLDAVTPELLKLEAEFNQWKTDLVNDYPQLVKEWGTKFPKYKDEIDAHAKDVNYLEQQISFDIEAAMFTPSNVTNPLLEKTGTKITESLPQHAYNDASKVIESILKNSEERKLIRRVSVNVIKEQLVPKLKTYRFIHKKIGALADYLEQICIEADTIFNSSPKPILTDKDYDWFCKALKPIANRDPIEKLLKQFNQPIKTSSPFDSLNFS